MTQESAIFCYALIQNNINNSAIYSLNAALLNYRGPTTCRDHPILSIVVLSTADHRFFKGPKIFAISNGSAKYSVYKNCRYQIYPQVFAYL
jgi:hypothetical protein